MEAVTGAQLRAADRALPPWESLPLDVLGRCLRLGSSAPDCRAAFSCCKAFVRAIACSAKEPSLEIYIQDFRPALARVLHSWTTDWGVDFGLTLKATASQPTASLQPLILLLQHEGICLPRITYMWCKGVLVDACAPAGLETVFPNLKRFEVKNCRCPPRQLPLAGCLSLRQLYLTASRNQHRADWLPQLRQLSDLPSLSSLTIDSIHEYPTSFLPRLAGQLTRLCLVNNEGSQRWPVASLRHAAQLTQLRTLELLGLTGSVPAQRLAVLTVLSQLQQLVLDFCGSEQPADSDPCVSTLLQFPHLTFLSLQSVQGLQQSYADAPCSWKQQRLSEASPQQLSRLPLHSLTYPLQLFCLNLGPDTTAADLGQGTTAAYLGSSTTVADVQAAVDNLVRSAAPSVCSWRSDRDRELVIRFGDEADSAVQASLNNSHPSGSQAAAAAAAAALRAAAPLVSQNITALCLEFGCVNAELVTATALVVPASVTTLEISGCILQRSCWSQLARSLPQLELLKVSDLVQKPAQYLAHQPAQHLVHQSAQHLVQQPTQQHPGCSKVSELLGFFCATGQSGQPSGTPPHTSFCAAGQCGASSGTPPHTRLCAAGQRGASSGTPLHTTCCAAGQHRQPSGTPQAACVQLSLSTSVAAVPPTLPEAYVAAAVQHYISTQKEVVAGINEHLQLLGFRTPGGAPTTVQVDLSDP